MSLRRALLIYLLKEWTTKNVGRLNNSTRKHFQTITRDSFSLESKTSSSTSPQTYFFNCIESYGRPSENVKSPNLMYLSLKRPVDVGFMPNHINLCVYLFIYNLYVFFTIYFISRHLSTVSMSKPSLLAIQPCLYWAPTLSKKCINSLVPYASLQEVTFRTIGHMTQQKLVQHKGGAALNGAL